MAIAAIGEVPRPWRMLLDDRLLTAISLIPPHPGLLPMQQIRQYRAVGNIGRRRYHRMDQLAAAVDPKMSLHPKIPLLALLGLMHLGIARLPGILGRRGRIDDRCIDNRAGGHLQSLRRQVPLHLVKQLPAQIMLLKQMAEAAYRGFVGYRLTPEI